jgi:hypothetical protein
MTRYIALPLILLAGLLVGCSDDPTVGYTAQSQYRTGINTVAVPLWTRGQDVYRRDIEFQLTEALIKRIELNTPYKVVKKDQADSILTGTIDRIEQSTLSFNPDTGRPREIQMTFFVSFRWKDLRTGNTLVRERNFRVSDVYLPSQPFGEDFFQGSQSLIDKLSRRIVETMETDWSKM